MNKPKSQAKKHSKIKVTCKECGYVREFHKAIYSPDIKHRSKCDICGYAIGWSYSSDSDEAKSWLINPEHLRRVTAAKRRMENDGYKI